MKQEQEQEKVLPYEALESLGINKKDLKASDTEALLAGKKSDLMQFSVEDTKERRTVLDKEKVDYSAQNGKLNFEGKVQLQKYMTVDNTEENKGILKGAKIDWEELQGNKLKLDSNAMRKVAIGIAVLVSPVTALALVLVPKRTEIKNDLGLSEKDIKALKQGEAVGHTNAKNERVLVQLDKDTNNLVSVRSNDISIPNKIAGQEITPIQREQLKNGQEIQVKDRTGQTVFAKIDLNDKTGLSLKDENGQKITIAPEQKTDITSKQEQNLKSPMNDTERLYVVSKIGVAGVESVYPDNPELRERFLQNHNLKNEVDRYGQLSTERENHLRADNLDSARISGEYMDKSDSRIKEIASQQYERKIVESLKTDISAVDRFKNDPEALEVIKRNGLENKFNEADKALQEFRNGMPTAESERKLDSVINSMKQEASLALDKFDVKHGITPDPLANDRTILRDIANNGVEDINNQYHSNSKELDRVLQNYGLDKTLTELYKQSDLARTGSEPEMYKANQEVSKLENKLKEDAGKSLKELDKEQKQTPEIKLTNDKDRLQHIANNGVDGIKDIHPTNTKLRDEFFEKHNLSKEVKRVDEISKLSPEEYNKQGKGLNKEMDSLSNSLKSKASGELSGFTRENSVKNEVKQETSSFKMKM